MRHLSRRALDLLAPTRFQRKTTSRPHMPTSATCHCLSQRRRHQPRQQYHVSKCHISSMTFEMQYPDEPPSFDGRPDPKAFIDWVNEMDHFFEYHKLADGRKVRFAKLKLISRAKFLWQSTEAQRRQTPISDWSEMIEVLSSKYIPYSYQQKKNLEAMQKRRNQFIEVLEQIRKFSNALYNDSDDTPSSLVVDEYDLSIRKLEELHSEFRDLQQDKDDRLNHVLELLKIVNSLCKVLDLDFEKTVIKAHPNLVY
ncbi:microtubule-associated protein 65-9 [Actinidia rufa]|uniref:Microtubule-associated protein 65-9 n=1 Tax=Actinidia rufa TaxID=165716 RepID=A0A7J0GXW1_9ERIC|nr:microtubule-associated protein 65-9 [Actinidia rufa]